MFADVLRDLFHRGSGVIALADERYFGVPVVATLPTASATYRGTLVYVKGGAGVADTLKLCRKTSADAYAWVTVTVS
jgi:hypothetical protein